MVVLYIAAWTQMRLLGGSECGPFTELQHIHAQQYGLHMHVPNIKTISRDVFEQAEVIRPVLHPQRDRLRGLQHLNVHLFCGLILHVHRVVLKDKR